MVPGALVEVAGVKNDDKLANMGMKCLSSLLKNHQNFPYMPNMFSSATGENKKIVYVYSCKISTLCKNSLHQGPFS